MTAPDQGLLDTSVLIAHETRRPLNTDNLPQEAFICVITLAELQAGVLAAKDTEARARRLETLNFVANLEPLPVDAEAAIRWATLRARLAEEGRRVNVNDLWIGAVALANNLPVITQDNDFDPLEDLGGPKIVRV